MQGLLFLARLQLLFLWLKMHALLSDCITKQTLDIEQLCEMTVLVNRF